MHGDGENRIADQIESLTRREREVLALMAGNMTNREIALKLTLEPDSVKWYSKQIYNKLGVHDRRAAVARAQQLGLIVNPSTNGNTRRHCQIPVSLTSFIGRQHELTQLCQMLTHPIHRLVTLTGAGGVGKTRLALRLAEDWCAADPAAVQFIQLATINNPATVIATVNAALGIPVEEDRTPLEGLKSYLVSQNLLLIFDNCEHIAADCAIIIQSLLESCPMLRILVTSREAVGVPGELLFPVSSLSFPNSTEFSSIEGLGRYEALALFIERARDVSPDFILSAENASTIIHICERLDGIPLALELAAARVNIFPIEQIALWLDESFSLLSDDHHTTLPRHKTMTASFEWSYQLLSEAERKLFQYLSVFIGGCTLEAIEQVCPEGILSRWQIVDHLTQLVHKSLVRVEHSTGLDVRYSLSEMTRQFAAERLTSSGEEAILHLRHAAWFLKLAEIAERHEYTPERMAWQKRIMADYHNLQTAVQWCLANHQHAVMGVQIILALIFHLSRSEYRIEGCRWLRAGLDSIKTTAFSQPVLECRLLRGLAFLDITAEPLVKISWLEKALALCRNQMTPDNREIAACLTMLGYIQALDQGNPYRGLALLSESESLLRQAGVESHSLLAVTLERKSLVMGLLGDHAGAILAARESSAIFRLKGFKWNTLEIELLGERAAAAGNFSLARQQYETALTILSEKSDKEAIAALYRKAGNLEMKQQRYRQAFWYQREALDIFLEIGWLIRPRIFAWLLEDIFLNEVAWANETQPEEAQRHYNRAACILGIEQGLLIRIGMPIFVERRQAYEQAMTILQTRMDPIQLENNRARGRSFQVTDAVKFIAGS